MGVLHLFLIVFFEILVMMIVMSQAGARYAPSKLEELTSNGRSPIFDRKLDIKSRVESLVASLELEEKLGLLVNTASGVPRLGISSYQWQNEGLHGVAHSPGVSFDGPIQHATSFPQPILTASSFNQTLFNEIGKV
jgi:beta-glucosidase-like glycosyl hydrolase